MQRNGDGEELPPAERLTGKDHTILRKVLSVTPREEDGMLVFPVSLALATEWSGRPDPVAGLHQWVKRLQEAEVLSAAARIERGKFRSGDAPGAPRAEYVTLIIPQGDLPELEQARNTLDQRFGGTEHHEDLQRSMAESVRRKNPIVGRE